MFWSNLFLNSDLVLDYKCQSPADPDFIMARFLFLTAQNGMILIYLRYTLSNAA